MKLAIIIVLALMTAGSALAQQPIPVPRAPGAGGSPPHGYWRSGSFYVPREGAQYGIAKPPNGTCPLGWTSSSSYCLRPGR
jgi:hypothetical protein